MENFIMRNLYDASIKGCVSTLKTLLQRDPLILNRISLYPFSETPLHNASLLGHLELCQFLLGINPNLASEVNSEGHCPLHLASAKGHTEIVKTLLLTDSETCLIRDKDDKVPLHFAVMRGRVGVIKELISAMPETEIIRVMSESDDHGSILHLCVLYNHLEALKILVESVRGDIDQFLCSKAKEGNTILDLAVKRGQIKIIKYLLSLSEKSETINTSKTEALRALHKLEHCPRDFISHTNEHILTEQEAQTSTNIVIAQQSLSLTPRFTSQQNRATPPNNDPPQPPQSLPRNNPLQQAQPSFIHPLEITNPSPHNNPSHPQPSSHDPSPTIDPSNPPSQFSPTPSITNELHNNRWDRFENFCNTYLINQGYWIDQKTKEQLMVAATVIATMTFQSVISPPGGVWQEDTTKGGYACPDYGFCEAGTAVVGYVWSPDFLKFIFFNSASFFASLCVLLVLVSGFPLHNRVIVWLLAVLMIVAITCMLLTYMWALGLVSPNHIFYRIRDLGYILVGIWSFLLFVVCFIQIIRIVFWIRSRRRDSTNVAL